MEYSRWSSKWRATWYTVTVHRYKHRTLVLRTTAPQYKVMDWMRKKTVKYVEIEKER